MQLKIACNESNGVKPMSGLCLKECECRQEEIADMYATNYMERGK